MRSPNIRTSRARSDRLRLVASESGAPRLAEQQATTADTLEALYEAHYAMVFHLALRIGKGCLAWAEDITQDVFLRLYKQLDRDEPIDNIEGWLYRTTTNRGLSRLRRDRFLDAAPIRLLLGSRQRSPATPEELGVVGDELSWVFSIVNAAPAKQRVCFYMYHVDQRSLVEIGATIGHSKGYVCKLIKRLETQIRTQQGAPSDLKLRNTEDRDG